MKKIIGKVSNEERDIIKTLFERKNGLAELAKILAPDNILYEKLVVDMGETTTKFQQWWDGMGTKYNWESVPDGKWSINFETCEIYLEK